MTSVWLIHSLPHLLLNSPITQLRFLRKGFLNSKLGTACYIFYLQLLKSGRINILKLWQGLLKSYGTLQFLHLVHFAWFLHLMWCALRNLPANLCLLSLLFCLSSSPSLVPLRLHIPINPELESVASDYCFYRAWAHTGQWDWQAYFWCRLSVLLQLIMSSSKVMCVLLALGCPALTWVPFSSPSHAFLLEALWCSE